MKNFLPSLLLSASITVSASAQAVDIGLTMGGGPLTVIYGQECGPVNCTPFIGGTVGLGESRNVMHLSAPGTLYAIALGSPTPGVGLSVPGFDNVLLLSNPIVIGWGLTSAPPFVPTPCQQGVAGTTFTIPPTAPVGLVFRVQSFGQSSGGGFAFGPAIEATIL